MSKLTHALTAAILAALPAVAAAQTAPLSDNLSIDATKAWTWQENQVSVAQFDGPVKIELDNVQMSADSAVVWITPTPTGSIATLQQVEIALVGNAVLQHAGAKRSGDHLFVTAMVRGAVRVSAQDRLARNRSEAGVYQVAAQLRDESGYSIRSEEGRWRQPRPTPIAEAPATRPAGVVTQPITDEVTIKFGQIDRYTMPDNTLAFAVNKGLTVTIRHRRGKVSERNEDQVTQLVAERGVVFTHLKQFSELSKLEETTAMEGAAESVYLEGDVRVFYTPNSARRPDVQLEANQVYYEINTDRAVLTDAVMHTMDPSSRIPVIIRAQTLKQLSRDDNDRAEYRAQHSKLTTSTFATPSYSVGAEKAYVRRYGSGDDYYGSRTDFSAQNSTLNLWDVPVFWMPYSAGSVTDRGFPLRSLDIGSSSRFGFFTRTEWGLFESIGRQPPRDLDLSYHADYLSERGPATGIDGSYRGSNVTENTKEPWSFEGAFRSYFVYDTGDDKYGADRYDVPAEVRDQDLRGRIHWQHQQFLPEDWQIQMNYTWISDQGFLEEYFPEEYRGIEPQDAAFYAKHQRDTEALTLLIQTQPNNLVTTQEYAQEKFEVERLPQLGYYRTGDSFGDNSLTFFSANTVSRLHFEDPHTSIRRYDRVQGYPTNPNLDFPVGVSDRNFPEGIPAEGYTARTNDYVNRGDFREEVTYPITVDKFRVMPYVVGRYTAYDESPEAIGVPGGGSQERGLAGAGVRMTTAFWQVDDYAQSELWDIHRMRHVIEPELNLFTSVSGTKPQDVYVFDEPVDAINDISAAQLALHQRWQTKRGAPGKWQSVDFFTWNIEGNFFFNKPDSLYGSPSDPEPGAPIQLAENDPDPRNFRGLYFPSAPETSVPRNSVNSDQLLRISDSTAFLSDEQYNLDQTVLATAAAGFAVRRGDRITYYVGDRYIDELNSNIVSFLANYELSTKYSLGFGQSYDFGDSSTVSSNFSVIRRFDRFFVAASVRVDETTGDSGFFINIRPAGAPSAIAAQNLPTVFR